ncbi:MAG: PIN domain-containing protein [Planctomycetes bacterium]|nr:PIN domain-containing protein [Planctomycetota bacterium]
MRIFLDANILFSAANLDSNIARLIKIVINDHLAVTSDFALEEARRNVQRKRPDWCEGFVTLASQLDVVPSVLFNLPVELDEKDRPILCVAIRADCDLLVTGDRKHFGHLYEQTVECVTIVSALGLGQRIADNNA